MTGNEVSEKIAEFVYAKHALLNADHIPSKETIDVLIEESESLGLPASKAQLERYRDHYYPEDK